MHIEMRDTNGTALHVGDIVYVPCRVERIAPVTPDFGQVTVRTLRGRKPDNRKMRLTICTSLVVLAERSSTPPPLPQ